jgi:4-amino-4-deoxy-L-arabinose transferase-like glycosyltransferase
MSLANKSKLSLFLVILIATGIRLIYIAQLDEKLYWADEKDFYRISQNIVDMQEFVIDEGEPTAFRAPGYPLVLAAMRLIGVDTITEIRLFHIALMALTMLLIFHLSLEIYNQYAAWFAVIYTALYPYFIYITGPILATTWIGFLLILTIWAAVKAQNRDSWIYLVLAGLAGGWMISSRPITGILLLGIAIWLFWFGQKRPQRRLIFAMIYVFIAVLVTVPWILRNHKTFGFVGLVSNMGHNLYLGNNAKAPLTTTGIRTFEEKVFQALKGVDSESRRDSILRRFAFDYIQEKPFQFVKRSLRKGVAFWRITPSPTTERQENSPHVVWASILSVTPLWLLMIYGMFALRRTHQKWLLLWLLMAIAYTLVHAPFIAKVRFRLPLDFVTIIIASGAFYHLLGALKQKFRPNMEAQL